jgi:hypothetical protein
VSTRTRTVLAAAAALTLIATASGCTWGDDKKASNVKPASEADVIRHVNQYADETARIIGGQLFNQDASSAACEGRSGDTDESVRYVQGSYNVRHAPGKRNESLIRLRDHWRTAGWTLTVEQTSPPAGELDTIAAKSADGYTISATTTDSPTALMILIHSDCYRSTDPP